MKLSYLTATFLAIFSVLAYNNTAVTYPDGPPNNRCGLYGTQPTCTNPGCHAANAGATNTLTIAGNPTSYTPGQTYSITVSATGGLRYGFEIACVRVTSGANAGTFVAIAGTEIANGTVSGNSIAFLKQNAVSSSGTWTFNWTAPATDVGNLTFYLATLSANNNNSASGDKTQTRTLTLTPENICPPLSVNITGNSSICSGQSTTFTANGGNTYIWSNGSGIPTTTANTAGTYTVTATDANGCTGTASTNLTVSPNPTASILGANSFCAGGNTTLTANGNGTYLWSNGSTASAITVSTAGNYTLTVTNTSACTANTSISVTQTAIPSPNISQSGSTCANGIGVYTVSNPGANGTQYNWTVTGGTITSGQGTASITVQWDNSGEGAVSVNQTNP